MADLIKLEIDRKTWYRGRGDTWSRLLREDGQRCCLGFLGQVCGYSDDDLEDVPNPEALIEIERPNRWPEGILKIHEAIEGEGPVPMMTDLCSALIHLNDLVIDPSMRDGEGCSCSSCADIPPDAPASEQEREERIAALFLKAGVEVTYHG